MIPDIDFTKSFVATHKKTVGLHRAVVRLFEAVMNDPKTTDEERNKLAKVRSFVDIHLRDL